MTHAGLSQSHTLSHVIAIKRVQSLLTFIGYSVFGLGVILFIGGISIVAFTALQGYYFNSGIADAFDNEGFNSYNVIVGSAKVKAATTPAPSVTVSVTPIATPEPTPLPPPEKNEALPKENMIIIPAIGVNSKIVEGSNAKRALYKGIWRDPRTGVPDQDQIPVVLAAHRYGYTEWTSDFKKTSSFRYLDQLKIDDYVFVIWNQREYRYRITKMEDSEKIYANDADIILYTCKHLNSPIRIIVFAVRV